MKRSIKLALAPLALVASCLLFAAPARAATYSGNCAGYTTGTYTSVTINDTSAACTIGVNVTSLGPISITATGTVTAKNVGSTNTVGAITISSGGSLTTGIITNNGNNTISITTTGSGANIQTGPIETSNGIIQLTADGAGSNIQTAKLTSTGSVIISAAGTVTVTDVSVSGTGNGGTIQISTSQLIISSTKKVVLEA